MKRRLALEYRVRKLENIILEGKKDQDVLNDFLGDDYYNKYTAIKNKISDPDYKDVYKLKQLWVSKLYTHIEYR